MARRRPMSAPILARTFRPVGVVGVRVGCVMVLVVMMVVMMVVMVMRMGVPVIVAMVVIMVVVMPHVQAAFAGAERVAQFTVGHVGPRRAGALTLDMVMMAFLYRADL